MIVGFEALLAKLVDELDIADWFLIALVLVNWKGGGYTSIFSFSFSRRVSNLISGDKQTKNGASLLDIIWYWALWSIVHQSLAVAMAISDLLLINSKWINDCQVFDSRFRWMI